MERQSLTYDELLTIGLRQESIPQSEWPYAQDWTVVRIWRFGSEIVLEGFNANYKPSECGHRFFWRYTPGVGRVWPWRFDFTPAIERAARNSAA